MAVTDTRTDGHYARTVEDTAQSWEEAEAAMAAGIHNPANRNPVISTHTVQTLPVFTPRKDDRSWQNDVPSAEDLLAMRLRFKPGMAFGLRHISAYCDDKTAVVMVVTSDGKSVMLEDDPALYPSDTLVTKIRILIGAGAK